MNTGVDENICEKGFRQTAANARINRQCHKSLDEFVDFARLRSFDLPFVPGLNSHIKRNTKILFLSFDCFNSESPDEAESYFI